MSNPRPLTQFAFASGIDESQQAEVLEPSAGFTRLENVRQDRRGAVSKRLGYDYLDLTRSDGTTRGAGRKLFSHADRLCTVDGTHLDVYSETLGASVVVGRVPEAGYRLLDAPNTSAPLNGSVSDVEDVILVGSLLVILHSAGGTQTLSASIVDTGGTVVRPPEVVFTGGAEVSGALGVYGSVVCLLASDVGSTANIKLYTIDCTSYTTIATGWTDRGNVATDRSTTTGTAALWTQSFSDRVAFAYVNNSAGTSRATVKTVTTAGVVQSQTINTSSVTPDAVTIAGADGDTLWVAWNETVNVKVIGISPTSLSTTLATTATAVSPSVAPVYYDLRLVVTGTGTGRVYCNATTDGSILQRPFSTVAGATTMGTGAGWFSICIASKVFAKSGRYYAFCYAGGGTLSTNDQAIFVLCDLTDTSAGAVRPVASIEPGLANAPITRRAHVVTSSEKAYSVMSLTRTSDRAAQIIELDFASTTRWQPVSHGGSTFMTGGVTSKFDGSRMREAGFLVSPSKPTSTRAAGMLSPAMGYRWVATYETVDGDGNWVVSGVSAPSDLSSTTANSQYTVTTRTLTMTGRFSSAANSAPERVVFYRTTDGGSVYYKVRTVSNSTSAATVSFTDTTTDTTLQTAAKLYGTGAYPGTAGAGQDRRAPPGFSCLVSYNDMLVGATGSTLWHSSQSVVGEAVWFNPLFRLDMVDGGEVTALAAQDGTLYVFKRRSVFAVTGEPPADNGSSGGLGTPRKLAADVGCIDPRSVVVTALGVFFQSERGLELLTRGQSVEWIGEAVLETLASYPVVTSATLDSAAALVRFTCAASETSNAVSATGVHLVYDLTLRTWVSVDKVTNGNGASRAAQSASMVYLGGSWRFGWLDKDGRALYEQLSSSGSAYLDLRGTYWITMLAETSWTKLGGLQGRHLVERILVLARKSTRADLSMSLAYDFGSSYQTPYSWTADTLDALASSIGRLQVAHAFHDGAEGTAVRVLLQDATPTGGTITTGKGATWIGLAFQGTAREGSSDLPDSAR